MSIFNREKFVLIDTEEREVVWEGKELISKESVQQDIEDENLEDKLYRLEIWSGGRKVRNAWVMRKARKKPSPEELAEKSREEAESYIQQSAKDIKKAVEDHQAFVAKVKETYGIEGGSGVDSMDIPTGKDGNLGILEAAQIAIAQSTYEGIRKTRPEEVSATFTSVMNSATTIFAGVAEMITSRITDSKKLKGKRKEPEKKKEEEKEVTPEPKVETHKEVLGDGKTKVTFGANGSTDTSHQKLDSTSVDIPKIPVPATTYEEYKRDMVGGKEEFEEELETA